MPIDEAALGSAPMVEQVLLMEDDQRPDVFGVMLRLKTGRNLVASAKYGPGVVDPMQCKHYAAQFLDRLMKEGDPNAQWINWSSVAAAIQAQIVAFNNKRQKRLLERAPTGGTA